MEYIYLLQLLVVVTENTSFVDLQVIIDHIIVIEYILICYYAWWFGGFGPYGLLLVYVF
jgi:hypothetical protein